MTSPHQQALHALAGLQQAHELSIIHISEQISSSTQASNPRTSDVSDAFENPTPQSLASDLAHYKVSLHLHVPIYTHGATQSIIS